MTTGFFQVQLRTLELAAARNFYGALLGTCEPNIVQLHEQAVARGARPHGLGYLEVRDVEHAAAAFLERGGHLFSKWVNPEGLEAAVMRDPGGAIVALAKPARATREETEKAAPHGPDVCWYSLNSPNVAHAKANYGELFAWDFRAPVDLGALGVLHPFAYEPGAEPVGSMSDIAERPGLHPHWLFHFRVPSLEVAVEAVRAGGGMALDPITLSDNTRVAVCDDPQGAAFALREAR